MPPCVGSGCRQISVATAARASRQRELADQGQPVGGTQRDILAVGAGSTVLAVISVIGSSPVRLQARARPARATLPARIVPVPPLVRPRGLGRPDHDVRGARPDLLVAAGAPVGLGRPRRRGPAGPPSHRPASPASAAARAGPMAVVAGLRRWAGTASSAGLARRIRGSRRALRGLTGITCGRQRG